MTVKELRDRLRPGVRLLLIEDVLGKHRSMRWVVRRTTRGCRLGTAETGGVITELLWPRRGQLRPFPGGFAVLTGAGAVAMKFVWVDTPPPSPDDRVPDEVTRDLASPHRPARREPNRPARSGSVRDAPRDDAALDPRLGFTPRAGTCIGCGHPFVVRVSARR